MNETIESKLNELTKALDADKNSNLRVKNQIFQNIKTEKKAFNFNLPAYLSRYIMPLSILGSIAIFVFTPLVFFKFQETNLPINTKNLGGLAESALRQSPDSSEAQTKDYYGYGQDDIYVDRDLNYEDTTTPSSSRAQTKYGYLNIEVANFDNSYKEILTKLEEVKGYVVRSGISKANNTDYADLEVRVPSSEFDSYINYLRAQAIEIISENINISDSQNYISQFNSEISDLNKQIAELQTKSDLTTAQQTKLSNLKAEKETKEKNLKQMQLEADYSTISIKLTHKLDIENNLGNTLNAAKDTLVNILHFWLNAIIWIGIALVALSPILLIGFFVIKKVRSRK